MRHARWDGAKSSLWSGRCWSSPKLVLSQNSVQDITGAFFQHCEKDSRTRGGLIPQEKIVNLINDIFWAGKRKAPGPPSISACCSLTALPSPQVHQTAHQPHTTWYRTWKPAQVQVQGLSPGCATNSQWKLNQVSLLLWDSVSSSEQ